MMKKIYRTCISLLLMMSLLGNQTGVGISCLIGVGGSALIVENAHAEPAGTGMTFKKDDQMTETKDTYIELAISTFILFLATIIGLDMAVKCKKAILNMSLITYLVACVLHVAAEIMGHITYKNTDLTKDFHLDLKNSDNDEERQTAKEAQLNQFKHLKVKIDDSKKWVETRKWMTVAVAALYGLAAIFALVELKFAGVKDIFTFKCYGKHKDAGKNKNMKDGIKELKDGIKGIVFSKPFIRQHLPGQNEILPKLPDFSEFAVFTKQLEKSGMLTDTLGGKSLLSFFMVSEAHATNDSSTSSADTAPTGSDNNSYGREDFMNPNQWLKAIGWSGVLIGLLIAFKSGTQDFFHKALALPVGRAIIFFSMGGLASGVAYQLDVREKILVKRSDSIQKTIDSLSGKLEAENTGDDPDTDNYVEPPAIEFGKDSVLLKKQAPCMTSQGGQLVIDEKCDCKNRPTGCNAALPLASNPPNFSYPSALSNQYTGLQSVQGKVFGGDLLGAQASANLLGARGAARAKLKQDAINQINDDLKKIGESPVDFDKTAMELADALKGAAKREAKAQGVSLGDLGGFSGDLFNLTSDPEEAKAKDNGGTKGTSAAAGAGGGGGGSEGDKGNKEGSLDFSIEDESATVDTAGDLGLDEKGGNADKGNYEDNFQDISQNKTEDIFKLLSKRYLITAYPRFLSEEGAEEAPKILPVIERAKEPQTKKAVEE